MSWTFQPDREGELREDFFFGNWLLAGIVRGYPRVEPTGQHRRNPQHIVDTVLELCGLVPLPLRWAPPDGIRDGGDVMVGYLLLDALVLNTDRHDENWGLVRNPATTVIHLAPTFDHASSLGRELTNEERARRLGGTDPRFTLEAYVRKATSGLYAPGESRPLHPLDAFKRAARIRPDAAAVWLGRLRAIPGSTWRTIVEQVPDDWMSPVARTFAIGILEATCEALVGRMCP